jgi:hypothetical protein
MQGPLAQWPKPTILDAPLGCVTLCAEAPIAIPDATTPAASTKKMLAFIGRHLTRSIITITNGIKRRLPYDCSAVTNHCGNETFVVRTVLFIAAMLHIVSWSLGLKIIRLHKLKKACRISS